MEQSRRTAYDILRVIAFVGTLFCLAVLRVAFTVRGSLNINVLQGYLSLFSPCLGIFILLMGAFGLDSDRAFCIKSYFFKTILRLGLVIVCWGVLYAALSFLTLGSAFTLKDFIKRAFIERDIIYWLFIPFGLALLTPILRPIAKDRILSLYFLAGAFLFAALLPTLQLIKPLDKSAYITDLIDCKASLGYAGLYVAGSYLKREPLPKALRISLYALGVIGVFVTFMLFTGRWTNTILFTYNRLNGNYLFLLLPTLALFVAGTEWDRRASFPKRTAAIFEELSRCTLGAYLLSLPSLKLLSCIGLTAKSFTPLAATPLTVLCAAILCYGIAYLLRRIPIFNRYLL